MSVRTTTSRTKTKATTTRRATSRASAGNATALTAATTEDAATRPNRAARGERRRVREAELDYDGVANVPSFTIRTKHTLPDLLAPGYWDGALATGLRLFNRIRFTCEGNDSVTCGELVVLAIRDATGPDGSAHDRVRVGELWSTTLSLPQIRDIARQVA